MSGLPVGDVEALHRFEPWEHVLEHARFHVVRSGHAVGSRRALVERPRRAVLRLLEAAREDPLLVPPLDHLVIERDEVDMGWQRVVHQAPRASRRLEGRPPGTRRVAAVPPSLAPLMDAHFVRPGSTGGDPMDPPVLPVLGGDFAHWDGHWAHTVPSSLRADDPVATRPRRRSVDDIAGPVGAARLLEIGCFDPYSWPPFEHTSELRIAAGGRPIALRDLPRD